MPNLPNQPSKRKKDVRARERKIMELANSNLDQDEIAEMVGVSQATVSRTIDRVMARFIGIEVSQYRASRLAKLYALEQTWYPRARNGDAKANHEWLDIDKRIKEYVPGAEMPKQVDMSFSTDEKTDHALAILAQLRNAEEPGEPIVMEDGDPDGM